MIMNEIILISRNNPQIVVFLALGLGYLFGNLKYKGFSFGATTGVLIMALVLGQVDVEIPQILKNVSFALFMFCIGYKVGPQFFGALKKQGLSYIWLAVIVAITSLFTALFLAKLFGFDAGTAAGFFAGSVTQSAALGTAEGAIRQLLIPATQKTLLESNAAVAYAITYIFGTAGGIMFFKVAPFFMRIKIKKEARILEEKMSGSNQEAEKPGLFSWTRQLSLRAYHVTNSRIFGRTVEEIEKLFLPGRISIEKIKRGGQVLLATQSTVIEPDDRLVIMAPPRVIISVTGVVGPEVDVGKITNITGESMGVCVLNKKIVGKTLGELSRLEFAHGIFLKQILRQGHEIPVTRDIKVNKCDILHLIGAKEDVEKAVAVLGYAERPIEITDMIMVGIGCVLGSLLGLISVTIAGIPISLGLGGGVLFAGLMFGWLRTLHPTFGQIPSGGQWILQNLGLNLFIACVGLGAAPEAIHAMKSSGVSVLLAGMILCLTPFIVGLIFAKYVLKMNPVLLLGGLAGARVITAALNTLQEDSDSTMPAIGYAIPFAFANVLLTVCGTLIVNLM